MLNLPVTAKKQIYDWLKNEIITNRIKPGSIIDKKELKEQFNVSITPLREALILLSREGLLEFNPNLNTRVTLIDIEIIRESIFIRGALEGSIAETLAERGLTDNQVSELNTILSLHESALKRKEIKRVYSYDFEFHQLLSQFSGYPSLWHHVEQYRIHIDRVLNCSPDNMRLIRASLNDHKKIVEAIEHRSPLMARNRMRKHVERIFKDIKSLPKEYIIS